MQVYQKLSEVIGLQFKDLSLINLAFIHRSYLNEAKDKIPSNERLEFLGDSILSFLTSEYLYRNYPKLPEGDLTNLRSSVVKTSTLAKLAKQLDLGLYLKLSHGEEEGGGRQNTSILADTFEAFLGAVYLDGGLEPVITILEKSLFPLIPVIYKDKSYKDAKSSFQELVQEQIKMSPVYRVLEEKGPDHAKEFTVGVFVGETKWGSGLGKNKQEAEQKAATDALVKWKKKPYNTG
ncbi:MAG: RNAse III, ribonuclease III [Candidatus Gottesmanbacteria bacterium GW2011_GWA2_43_14]|uniref:Ribonuclease 3 n=1 Tax=Candidatus Gottesmanbacteria bacterium GW2011_GWA2_43_14 TaxID=1618443 RepID=A0A0G1DKK5_9BACT|nr:MAG: RNAse III, ribonuclease III [Candidatus Gottesmanbacteria bacterium GW2011_GWA2_43_14]